MTMENDLQAHHQQGPVVKLAAWRATDVGLVREHNEDSSHADSDHGFFIVADGMGGHAAGEIASSMTVEAMTGALMEANAQARAFAAAPNDAGRRQIATALQEAVMHAHMAVYNRGIAEPKKQGMGTTLDVVFIAGDEAFIAHVGDSRTYLIRDGKAAQITTDHTVAEMLVIEGKLTPEEAAVSPTRNVLVNAIGPSAEVAVELAHVQLKTNDRMLLCSDGLHEYFTTNAEIAECLSSDTPGEALQQMIETAKQRGGHDNITGIVIHVVDINHRIPTATEMESTEPVELADLGEEGVAVSSLQARANRARRAATANSQATSDAAAAVPLSELPTAATPPAGVRVTRADLEHADTIPPEVRLSRNKDGSLAIAATEPGIDFDVPASAAQRLASTDPAVAAVTDADSDDQVVKP